MSESRLIRVLLEKGFIDQRGVERARHWQKKLGENVSLSDVLVRLGIVKEEDLTKALAEVEAVRVVQKISDDMLDYEAMMMLEDDFLRRYGIVLIKGDMGRSEVAHWREVPFDVMEQIQFLTNRVLEPVVAPRREVMDALQRYLELGELQRRDRALEMRKRTQLLKPQPTSTDKDKTSKKRSPLLTLIRLLVEKGILTEDDVVLALGEKLREKGLFSDNDIGSLKGE